MRIAALTVVILAAAWSIDAATVQRDVEALLLLKQEVENRDGYWAGAMESWEGGGPNGEHDPCGSSWKGNWEGIECRMQGDLPADTPRVVTNIHIPDRSLSGPLPMAVALLTDLIEIDMDGNKMTGPLNPFLGCLSKMRELDLANNTLTGTIPDQWAFMKELEEVEVHTNPQLTGCIPQGMPPTQTVCRDPPDSAARQFAQNFIEIGSQPICELIGTIVLETAVDGFCSYPNLATNQCVDPDFVREFIASGMDYDRYYASRSPAQPAQPVVQTVVPPAPAVAPVPVIQPTIITAGK